MFLLGRPVCGGMVTKVDDNKNFLNSLEFQRQNATEWSSFLKICLLLYQHKWNTNFLAELLTCARTALKFI